MRRAAPLGTAASLLALCLAAAAAVPAHSQEPAAAAAPPQFEQILVAGEYRYARSRRAGVHVSFDQGLTWQPRGNGLPHRVVYPFPDPPEYAAVTSLAADPSDPLRLAATTASGVYLSTDGGMAWQQVGIGQIHPHAYFTAVALSPHDPAGMLVGTSFHGIYETGDGGATWFHLTPAIRFLADRSLFYEEVAGLSYDPAEPRAMAVLAGFDGGVFYVANRFGEQRESPGTGLLRFPVPAMATIQLGFAAAGDGWELHAGTVDARWRLAADGTWSPIAGAEPLRRGVPLQPPAPGAAPPAAAGAATETETPAAPAADASPPKAPDAEAAAAGGSGAPEQPQLDAAGAEPAPEPADQAPPSTAGTPHTAVAAAADSGSGASTAAAAPAAREERVTEPMIAAGLPRIPPPAPSTPEPANEDNGDNENAAVQPSAPVADRQPAAPLAAAAGRHGDGVAAAPAPAAPEDAAAGSDSALPAAAHTASGGTVRGPGAEVRAAEHMLAAGEPGWIAGPDGIRTAVPLQRAALRNGIYIRADRAAGALPEYLDLLVRHGLDSVVIDFKDDFGRLGYDSELPLARAMGAAPGPIKLDRLVAAAQAAGIYVVARMVVFKDPVLYGWDNHRLAIWDREQDGPWRHLVPAGDDSGDQVQREHWVDPFAPEVWQYNIDVAAELAARGIDEIQFDYIRFPSDGPTERAAYRHRRPGMRRVDAIESFLALARERLDVPISTDLFGFNSWYRAGNFIGQDIEVLSEYADVISPMFYPSHFPHHFLADRSYVERAHDIYESGVRRAQRMVRGRAYIRPYVQAFLIGGELRMEEEEYGRYLTRQLDGNRAAAGSGFTLWNASNRYYMVTEPLQPYFDTRGEETP